MSQKPTKKTTTEEGTNPFSFRAYVESGAEEKIVDTDNENKPNPFSFKNFLAVEETTDTTKPPSPPPLTTTTSLPDLPDIPTPPLPSLPLDLPEIVDEDEDADRHMVSLPSIGPIVVDENERIIAKQREKIERLEKKLRVLMDKEANENETLARVVAQVEKRLEEANKRRVGAESALELARIENAQLKTQVLALSNENRVLKSTAGMASANMGLFKTIGEIAGEINEAALAAENSLTYLGAGVTTLRLIASRLESLEKISEIVG